MRNFWNLRKFIHILKQIGCFVFLPFIVFLSTFTPALETCYPCSFLIRQSQIPVNRFLYSEISKVIFFIIVLLTLTSKDDVAWYDLLSVFWILSYLLENIRTIHRYYRFGGESDSKRIFKRWLTFRNIYVLATDVIFLISLILRCVAFFR